MHRTDWLLADGGKLAQTGTIYTLYRWYITTQLLKTDVCRVSRINYSFLKDLSHHIHMIMGQYGAQQQFGWSINTKRSQPRLFPGGLIFQPIPLRLEALWTSEPHETNNAHKPTINHQPAIMYGQNPQRFWWISAWESAVIMVSEHESIRKGLAICHMGLFEHISTGWSEFCQHRPN